MSEPFRVLVLGDFSAREHRGHVAPAVIGDRRPRRVDRDDIDKVIAAFSPELHLALEPGAAPIIIPITRIDDFHPDSLRSRVSDLQRLAELKQQLSDPRTIAPSPASPRPAPSADSAAATLSGGNLLDMILAGEPNAPAAAARPRDDLSAYVDQAVRKHATPQQTADQETLMRQVDDVIAATMRVVLHHRDFQATEALWRGVNFLVWRLDTDAAVHVFVADVTKSELASAVTGTDDGANRGIRKLLRGEAGPGPWSLVLGAYTFTPDEASLVTAIAATARTTGVPWISAAHSRFAGIGSFAESADPDDWDRSPLAEWDAARRTENARWMALVLPRFLLRVPYGARSAECSMKFEETDAGQLSHDHYLWGNSAFLCGVLLAEAAASDEGGTPTHGDIDDLPLFIATVDGLAEVKPVAEALLSQRAIIHVLDRGLTAVASERDGDSVRIPRLQSIAHPAAPLASPASTD